MANKNTMRKSNLRVAALSATVAAGMVGLSFASVPLYRIFCQVTGFGGTTQRADAAPAEATEHYVTVRFDANTAGSLSWLFEPAQRSMKVKIGEENFAHYRATNVSDRRLTGTAVFNVTPAEAGAYFNKIECFCFTRQTLKAGETADLPISYFVDPAILEDANLKKINTITLSYTFYPADDPGVTAGATN